MSQNPYEAPRYHATRSSLTYYQPLSTKLNLREYRRISNGWFELLFGVGLKFLRIRIPMTFAIADSRHFQRIAPQDLSQRVREKIKPIADHALALNLKYAFSYCLPAVGTIEGAAAAFFSEDGRSVLLIAYARTWTKVAVDEKAVFAFLSRLSNGTSLVTSGAKGDLDAPPHIVGEAHPGTPMQEVFDRHLARLNDAGSAAVIVHDPDQLEQMLREHEEENFAFNIERGVYVPVSQGELARLQQLAFATPEIPRPKAKQQFQGIELICWIALVVTLFMFTRDQPANAAQAVFRLGILLAALAGIAIVWLIRGVTWMHRKADD
jgi:hypothetical protein